MVSYRRLNRFARRSSRLKLMLGCVQLVLGCVEQGYFFAMDCNLEPPPPLQHDENAHRGSDTTTAAADHQYATMAARTGTPTLARIGCRSAHDGGCMCSR